MSRTGWLLAAILFIGFILRFLYCWDLPLSGDESVSLLQAAGKALDYPSRIPHTPTPVRQLQALMEYSPDRGVRDVLNSMEQTGMHPPLYYLLLHLFLRSGLDNLFFLRFISILLSAASVWLLYQIAASILDKTTALLSAALLAASTFGIHYSGMLRPYPLILFLSLLTTDLLLKIETENNSRRLFLLGFFYSAGILAGLYTLYHFIFVLCFHFLYAMLTCRNRSRRLMLLSACWTLIGIFYLPWMPSFKEQLDVIRTGNYYFHSTNHPLKFLAILYDELFAGRLLDRYSIIWLTLFLGILPAVWFGIRNVLSTPRPRRVLLALSGYILLNLAADLKMNSHTLATPKLLFFVLPAGLLFLAAGLRKCWSKQPAGKLYALFLIGFFLVNTSAALQNPQTVDGPDCLKPFSSFLKETSPEEPLCILLNKQNVRFVLSFAYTSPKSWNLAAIENLQSNNDIFGLDSIKSAQKLAMIFLAEPSEKTAPLPREKTVSLIAQAEEAGFGLCRSISCRQKNTEEALLLFTPVRPEAH